MVKRTKFHHFMLGGILPSSILRFSFSFSPSSRILFKHVRPYQQSNDRTIACSHDQVEKKVPNVTILTHLLEWSISSPPAREDKTNHTDHDYFLSRKRFVGGGCINCKRKQTSDVCLMQVILLAYTLYQSFIMKWIVKNNGNR